MNYLSVKESHENKMVWHIEKNENLVMWQCFSTDGKQGIYFAWLKCTVQMPHVAKLYVAFAMSQL